MKSIEDDNIITSRARIILGESSPEVETIAPQKAINALEEPFPSGRTLRWEPAGAQAPQIDDELKLVVTQDVLNEVNRHTGSTLERELGGFLLGNLYYCPNTGSQYVLIDQLWEARFTIGTEVSLRLTTDTWADLTDQMQTRFRGKLLVGWYHSHPRMSVFLSGDDLELHESRFSEPWMVALVVEPLSRQAGFFGQQSGNLHPTIPIPFYEYFAHRQTYSVVDWTNYHRYWEDSLSMIDKDEVSTSPDDEIHPEMKVRTDLYQLSINYHPVRRRRSTGRMALALITSTLIFVLAGFGFRQWNLANGASQPSPKIEVESPVSTNDQGNRSRSDTDQNRNDLPSEDGQRTSSVGPHYSEEAHESLPSITVMPGRRQNDLPSQQPSRNRNGHRSTRAAGSHKSDRRVGPKGAVRNERSSGRVADKEKRIPAPVPNKPRDGSAESTDKSSKTIESSPSAKDESNKLREGEK